MALNISFSGINANGNEVKYFSWDNNLPLISESTAQSYESNDYQYYSYTTITLEGRHEVLPSVGPDDTTEHFPTGLYNLCVSGITGTLNIGGREYYGYFTNLTLDGDEPSSVRWSNHIPYVLQFSTFPFANTYESNFASTFETMPYDQKYGPVYKVTQNASAGGVLLQIRDTGINTFNRSTSGVTRAFNVINAWYASNIVTAEEEEEEEGEGEESSGSYFGYKKADYDFYDLDGTTEFDELTGQFSVSLSWLMKPKAAGDDPDYQRPYHIIETSTSTLSTDLKRTYQRQGTVQGFSTGLFPTGLTLTTNNGNPISFSFGFSRQDRYKHALSGFATISTNILPDTLNDILPEDDEWHGGEYFKKQDAPPLITGVPAKKIIGYNPYDGSITYNYTYDDQPPVVIEGAIVETISVRDKAPGAKYQQIQVIGRRHGPILKQEVAAYDIGTKTITYEGFFPRETTLKRYSFKQSILNAIDNYVMGFAPSSTDYNVSIVEDNQELNLTSNKVSRIITWNYSKCPTSENV